MRFIKILIPEFVLRALRPIYHGVIALFANVYFGRPSDKLTVIGITGTTGKSTTAAMLAYILNTAGKKCGYITTVEFFDGSQTFLNKHGLSMPGGWLLQNQLKQMSDNGCRFAIIECTSEGLQQNRHLGIGFDMAIFTNLSEAHLRAHGGFEQYKLAKGRLFRTLSKSKKPKKTILVNLDEPFCGYFLQFAADFKAGVTFEGFNNKSCNKIYETSKERNTFKLAGQQFVVQLPGEFNLYNALLAAAAADCLDVDINSAAEALASFRGIRGRMEEVENKRGIKIIVDYGCEPASFKAALKAASQIPHHQLIHVFGSTGGHRDTAKQFIFGQTSAQYSDYIIITSDDIYDSDPNDIAKNIESGIRNYELWKGKFEIILDRQKAIHKALSMATAGDLILITGKGSEQFLVLPGNKRIAWDEVGAVKQELGIKN